MQSTFLSDQLLPFISRHWSSFLALLIIFIFIIINELMSQKNRATMLSPQAAVELMNNENAHVFDLRDAKAFSNGHITNAVHISADGFEQKKMEKYKTKPLILVCERGTQSAAVAAKLRKLQFEKPMILAGGIAAWEASNLPLIKGKN